MRDVADGSGVAGFFFAAAVGAIGGSASAGATGNFVGAGISPGKVGDGFARRSLATGGVRRGCGGVAGAGDYVAPAAFGDDGWRYEEWRDDFCAGFWTDL